MPVYLGFVRMSMCKVPPPPPPHVSPMMRASIPGLLNFDSTGKAQLKVLSKPRETDASQPVLVGPDSRPVKQCYCMKSGR